MRVRHASTVVAICSAPRSASEVTGTGALTITSCTPAAGWAVKRSGFGCGAGVSASGLTAGKRLGTERTSQPGVSGSPPSGRSAHTSGGVRSSWPSRNGSFSGSTGSAGSAEKPPPGREARPAAMIDFSPVSGSTRSSFTDSFSMPTCSMPSSSKRSP